MKYFLVVHLLLFSFCLCEEVTKSQKEKFLTGFVEFYNNLPNQIYQSNEGSLQSTQKVDDITYKIVANIKATEIRNIEATKSLQCTATIQESEDDDITVTTHHCQEPVQSTTTESEEEETETEAQTEVTEPTVTSRRVQLENEVQSDTAVTSGEQFIAIPRGQPSAPCIGCASHVNPQAAGVSDLANLGVRHLDIHEPSVKHSLDSVVDVERQVQVVNGVRYILTLLINSNNCTEVQTENCVFSKTCKITILVKPRVKLPNGENYRAILANNCTEEWQYGDNGEVLPEPTSNNDIQVKHNTDVQSQPGQERTLTNEELKSIQDQIIPNNQFQETTEPFSQSVSTSPDGLDESKQHVFKVESVKHNENSVPVTESEKTEQHSSFNINSDKKKAIDDMLDFFDFSGFKPKSVTEDVISRVRRSYDYDLQVLSLAEDFHGIKNSIENARFMYEMAQAMVDYLNEMDMEVKNRAVKDVVKAEEETENLQHFIYIQARVTIPCDKVECEPTDMVNQICNGVIDSTNVNSPQILNTFCYNENKERDYREIVKEIPLDDPVLQNLAEEALKKIETESKSQYAMKINKIASAITQVTSGTLTKFSIIVENIKCNKSVPLALRINCTVLEQLGSRICEVIIHERHWLNERKISYTCTDRPVDMRISKTKSILKNVTVDDPKVVEMLQEAIQYLETQSDKNNKQKIVNINSIASQIIAGFLTKIEFVVGYTNCTDENNIRNELLKCELLKDEGLRLCKAQIWDRSWIMDGRQVEVSCDDVSKNNESDDVRKKRSIDFIAGQDQGSASNNNHIDYKKIAEESLKKFMLSSTSRQHYEVIKVDKVKSQEVPGKLIRILFSISPTNCFIQKNGLLSSSKCVVVNPKKTLHCRSKVLQNVWIDKKQYFVNCNIEDHEQQKTSAGLKERNPNSPKYYQLAEESLTKYLHDTDNNLNHKIVRLEKVTTQIVSGLLTNIDFIISPITQTGSKNQTVKCHSEILEKHWLGTKDFNVSCQMKTKRNYDSLDKNLHNPKYMHIAVEALEKYIQNQPESHLVRVTFVDKVEQEGKTVKIRFMASHTENDDGDTLCYAQFSETRVSTNDIEVKCHFIGKVLKQTEITEEDPNFNKYVQLAEDSLRDYLQSINSSQLYTIVSIESVTVQWDESIKTLINFIISPIDIENSELQGKICLAEIREQPWLNKKNTNIKCELEKELYRTKRQISQEDHSNFNKKARANVGGISEIKEQDLPRFMELAEESLRKYVIDNKITQPLRVGQVERASTQLVSGSLTRLDFLASGEQGHITMRCHSEVWEQPWLNFKQINVTCFNVNARNRRDVPGGITEQDPRNPHYMELAEQSLRKYLLENDNIPLSVEVALVKTVTTQIVAGMLTRIDFLVLSRYDPITMECHSEVLEQSWLNNTDITVSCPKIFKGLLPGGLTLQDPSKPEYKVLAQESLQKYVRESKVSQLFEVASVEKVTTQVVSGILTRIDFRAFSNLANEVMKCHSEIVEQSWRNIKQINVSCFNVNAKKRRDVPGGITEQDPRNPHYMELAEQSLRKYLLENRQIPQSVEVALVEKVTTQVVAGMLTRIDFLVLSRYDPITMECHSEVLEQSWLNNIDITVSCPKISKGPLLGGLTLQDPSNPEYKVLAQESLQKYVRESKLTQLFEVASVEKVTTQVGSGILTRIDFRASSNQASEAMKCHSEVVEQSLLDVKNINVACFNVDENKPIVGPGAITEQDPRKPRYMELAEQSLREYLLENRQIPQSVEVALVKKVTTQVVSGMLTRIDFLVLSRYDSIIMDCHSEVLEQPWLNNIGITVSCPKITKGHVLGGLKLQDPSKPEYKVLAQESLQKYVRESKVTQLFEVASVEKVITQLVSGSLTSLDFLASGEQGHITMRCHSEVWEQPWLNFKQMNVSCFNVNAKKRRDVPGGITEQDPRNPHYMELAEQSLRKYLLENRQIPQSVEVALVKKVTTQVVAGMLTRLDFLVLSRYDPITMECHSEVLEQSWLNNIDITVSCPKISKGPLLGGLTLQDPSNPEYKVLAQESLQKYVRESGATQLFEVASVEKVTTQVVSGILTRIDFRVSSNQASEAMKCHSEVVEQSWQNVKNINVACFNVNEKEPKVVPGGITEQDPRNPHYMELAEQSLRKYLLENRQIPQSVEVALVKKVTTQVVAGMLTRLDFLVLSRYDPITMECHSEVLEQPWLNNIDITVSCPKISKGLLPGGLTLQDPSKPEYKVLAQESLQKYVRESKLTQLFEVASVEKVTTQVVSGILTRIDFRASSNLANKVMKCHSEIVEQSWRNIKQINVTCFNVNAKKRRDVLGGITEQDPRNPHYMELAEQSLRKYLLENRQIPQSVEVALVKKVTTQVVAGMLTRLDFLVLSRYDPITMECHSEVLEQSWLNNIDITVSCPKNSKGLLPGGLTLQDPSKPEYKVLAQESLQKYVRESGATQLFEVASVEKVTTQVVSGILTRIDFRVSSNQASEAMKCHSEVVEQSWQNVKNINVACFNVNEKEPKVVPGGITEQDPRNPHYMELAEQSLRKYLLENDNIPLSVEVALVQTVTTQVVAGMLTRLDFLVLSRYDPITMECHSEVLEQSWLNNTDITVFCPKIFNGLLPGGLTLQDPSKPEYKVLAQESLQKYVRESKLTQLFEVASVEKVTTQVVSGILTRIDFRASSNLANEVMKCHSEIVEQSWRNIKQINVSCFNVNAKKRRDVPGGITEQDPTKPHYKVLAEQSLNKYLIEKQISQSFVVTLVEKVTTQVVSGSITRIDFLASGGQDHIKMKCHSEIREQPWLNIKEFNVSCFKVYERVKRHLTYPGDTLKQNPVAINYETLGAESIHKNSSQKDKELISASRGHIEEMQDTNKPEYKLLAEEALRKYQQKSTIHHKVVEVKRVVTRVVSGLKYTIDFNAAPTTCSVNVSRVRARSCKTVDDIILYCHTDIWDRPWLKQKKIDVKCYSSTHDDFEEYESDIDFSLKPLDVKNNNSEKYIKLAEEASEKYLTASNRKYVHKVTEILSVTEQIVDGTLTNIDYSLSPTTCLRNVTTKTSCKLKQPLVVFHCNAKIQDRPWLHSEKEIKVTCKKINKEKLKKQKRNEGNRNIRQIGDDEDELDEDTTFYYADRAIQHINDHSSSNNLHKLISIHAVQSSIQMGTLTVQMYIEVAETFCLRHHKSKDLRNCEEMSGLNHRLCLARLWPSPDDELVVRHVSVVCDDEENFESITGVNIPELLKMSIADLERAPGAKYKLVHQGEPQVIPSLDSKFPFKINFIVATTNCSKDVNLDINPFQCYVNTEIPSKSCHSFIWLKTETKFIRYINAKCTPINRVKRSALDSANVTLDNIEIQNMVQAALEKLEMTSLHRYKQRVLQINSHSTKITSGKVTTIDFDVGYTSCLKYEWVANITNCDFLEHLPRRRCVAQIWERLWISNGQNVDVNCVDDETPLESHIEFESAEMAYELAREALKHIEAKYPHPNKQKVVRIFSLEKQVVAGIHYKMKVEVGFTDCVALSDQTDCKLLKNHILNKFCRVNVWVRPWTDHPPNFRVSCDFQEGTTHDLYHHVQAEHLFYNFLTTYSPSYVNDYSQMQKRFEIFKNNVKKIHEFNVHEKGTARYGVTRFTDLTYEEFSSTYMGLKTNLTNENQVPMKKADIPDIKVPANFDWREYDAVTEVKDQGSCGSCWAFSVTGNIEGQWKMQSGQLVSLSEQELVDCDKMDDGCNGGLPDNAYRAIEQMGGLELESDYPYEGVDEKCVFNKTLAKVQINGAVNITSNETGMAQWLVHNGPISIGINANAMQFYMGGISHPWKMLCNPTNLDHGVLIVGYGIKDYPLFHKQLPYWIIKNSWGKSWGEQGYYRVYRGDGTCGVNQMASSAVI